MGGISFSRFYGRVCEGADEGPFSMLGYKIFDGIKHTMKMSVVRFIDDTLPPRIVVKSLNDPKVSGHVEYPTKKDAIMAFNNITTLPRLMDFVERYKNTPEAYMLHFIHADESEEPEDVGPKEEMAPPEMPEIPGIGGGGGMPGGGIGGGGLPPETTPAESPPGEVPGGTPPAPGTPPPPETTVAPETPATPVAP